MRNQKQSKWGVCPTCHTKAKFEYRGKQEGYDGVGPFELWNCATCGTTVVEKRIIFLPRRKRRNEHT